MVSVRSLLTNTSSTTPYKDLKAKLVSSYTLSHWQQVSHVIHHPGLGDRHPTALMDAMLALLPEDEVPGSLFLGLFLERLPVEMRDHLVASNFKNPSKMALHADRLWDAWRAQSMDSPVATLTPTSPTHAHGRDGNPTSPSRGSYSLSRRSQTPGPKGTSSSREVISTKDLVPQLTTAVRPAASRETPEPTGGKGTKQPAHRRFIDLST